MGNSCAFMRHSPKAISSAERTSIVAGMEEGMVECVESRVEDECMSIVGGMEEGMVECDESRVEEESCTDEEIEQSKTHWSTLTKFQSVEVGEGVTAEVDNVEVFKHLQVDPIWGGFFATFGHDIGGRQKSSGDLVMGKRFAAGGQAVLYHAQVTWNDAKLNERDLKDGHEWVVKAFKEGTFLRQVKNQLPDGYLRFFVEQQENLGSATPRQFPRYYCDVQRGILFKDGRFGFLMKKEHFDLRSLIERNLRLRSSEDCRPFSHDEAEWLMYNVAVGVKWLHEHDIVHRDLKAANVLVMESKSSLPKWTCYIADFECSVGVVGTGFFRAPEIMRALKDKTLGLSQEVFSKAADVYSYGMVCYEILTGKLPGPQILLPEEVDDWKRELLSRCWQSDPRARPSMRVIVNRILGHCPKIQIDESTRRSV